VEGELVRARAYRPLPPLRNTYSGVSAVMAECRDCPWRLERKNAMGTANIHARRTGHEVHVDQIVVVTYNRRDDP
jgi:hypothetical protein